MAWSVLGIGGAVLVQTFFNAIDSGYEIIVSLKLKSIEYAIHPLIIRIIKDRPESFFKKISQSYFRVRVTY